MISTALPPLPLIRRRRAVAVSDRLAFFYTLSFDFSENHQTVVYMYVYFVRIIVVVSLLCILR